MTRIALVHEPLIRYGGAERVLRVLHRLYSDAPIFTPYADRIVVDRFFTGADVHESFLAGMSMLRNPKLAMPFLPLAFESFDLRDFDVVFSSSSAFSKGVVTRSYAKHISYVHTPPRFLWEDRQHYLDALRFPKIAYVALVPMLHWLRTWDQHSAQRVDRFLANSRHTATRVKHYYQKESEVLYPPVDTTYHDYDDTIMRKLFPGGEPFYLVVARLTPHKRLDLAIETFSNFFSRTPLLVVGSGPYEQFLKQKDRKS